MKYTLIVVALIIVTGIAWYGISPFFDTKHVNDALPEAMETQPTNNTQTATDTPETTEKDRDEPLTQMRLGTNPVTVHGTTGHPASGTARIIHTTEGRILRYENFKTINGPNLHVYLATEKDGDDFIDLGPIKGTEGNINYTIPDDVDLEKYNVVLTWCVPFNVLFNYATLE